MTKQKTLVERLTGVVGHDRVYAINALREIADWIENDSNWYYLTPSQLRQEADRYD
jgi:hypothetical protein